MALGIPTVFGIIRYQSGAQAIRDVRETLALVRRRFESNDADKAFRAL
jgi:hypothetical protein